jgi:hypothetical protein
MLRSRELLERKTKTTFIPEGMIEFGIPNDTPPGPNEMPPEEPKAPRPRNIDIGNGSSSEGGRMGGVLGGSCNLWRHTGQLACFENHFEIHDLW